MGNATLTSLCNYFFTLENNINFFSLKYHLLTCIVNVYNMDRPEAEKVTLDINTDELYNLQYNFDHFLTPERKLIKNLELWDCTGKEIKQEDIEKRLQELLNIMYVKISLIVCTFDYNGGFGMR